IMSLFVLSALVSASAQTDKKQKNKKKDAPKLSVVEVAETPPVAPPVVALKPANGSLYTDNSVNGSLLRDFKARQIGDLVFVDVVETTTATVTSEANRKRDSGNAAGIVPLLSALPIGGAPVAGAVAAELGQ